MNSDFYLDRFSFELFVEPASAAFFWLLFFFWFFLVEGCASCSDWFLGGDACFDEFVPSADLGAWRYVSVWVKDLVLFEDFFEVHGFVVSGGVDDCAFFDVEVAVVGCCHAFGSQFVVDSFLP